MYVKVVKPFFDISVALLTLLLASPVIIIAAMTLAIQNDGQVFFKQQRPGYKGKIFTIYKMKTMNDKRDAKGQLLSDERRLTKMGKIIRKTSIDELPQLFNVLKGDMSIVGPRPLLVAYLELYNNWQSERHNVKPGITGWAQVNGRNSISWNEKFRFDVWYVNNQSFKVDLKILLLTIKKIVVADGVNQTSDTTMKPFYGNE